MTRLSVNINKIATLRNARGGNNPNLIQVAKDCETFGAEGITIHPRPDERHITAQDVVDLKPVIKTAYNIEGYPNERFLDLIKKVRPDQVTLVPDGPDAITSNSGWNTIDQASLLKSVIKKLKPFTGRVSVFVDPDSKMVKNAAVVGADTIELYTEPYAKDFLKSPHDAIKPYISAALEAEKNGLGINAGHDLDRENLAFFVAEVNKLDEVSIGHALICDALYLGLENTISAYLRKLRK